MPIWQGVQTLWFRGSWFMDVSLASIRGIEKLGLPSKLKEWGRLYMMRFKTLQPNFFQRDTETVARELLGKFLVSGTGSDQVAAMITEVEVYAGGDDQASHARFGPTKRNQPMFGPGGFWYVYLVYGLHYMLNVVTGPAGYPAAILIRAVEGCSGPGRVARRFKIGKEQ